MGDLPSDNFHLKYTVFSKISEEKLSERSPQKQKSRTFDPALLFDN
jgi:hypothetical protein